MTATRGTTNGNVRGSSESRRRRREWLVDTYAADVRVLNQDIESWPEPFVIIGDAFLADGQLVWLVEAASPVGEAACRCYRCGVLLTATLLTVDRILPGCQGGTYRRTNIRPACGPCNSETGGGLRRPHRTKAAS